jgi:hypothetical protein
LIKTFIDVPSIILNEWDAVVTKKLKELKNQVDITSCTLEIGEWPSCAAVQSNRQWTSSRIDNDSDNPFPAFMDECEDIQGGNQSMQDGDEHMEDEDEDMEDDDGQGSGD